MPSTAYDKFLGCHIRAKVLKATFGIRSKVCKDQQLVDQTFLNAAVAQAVGCWEGYIEAVVREFVSRTRIQAQRNSWALIAQFEIIVAKITRDLNTPNWDKARELLIQITGLDPYASWVWAPKFSNQNDTKNFFDGIMTVRHAFAHGFSVPSDVPGLMTPGLLDVSFVSDAISCIEFFAITTDNLLEHELKHRHKCQTGWR